MLREGTIFAQKTMDFFADRGVDCSVVDEHLSLLVTLTAGEETHEFRYGNRAFAGATNWRKFYQVLERELSCLKMEASARPVCGHSRHRRSREELSAV